MNVQNLENLKSFGDRLNDADRKSGISDKKPKGLVWPEPKPTKPVIPKGFKACVECEGPTKENCDYCGEPLCSGFLCSYDCDIGTVCMGCHEENRSDDDG